MADLQKKNGFTPLGNELLEHIFLFPFTRLDLAVIFMTIRFTHGYQRKSSGISLNKYVNNIKADRALISKSLQKLIKASVIKVILPEAGPRPRVLEFNDDYSQWDLSDFISGSSGLSPVQQPVLQGDQHSGLHPEQPLVLSPEQPHLKKEEKKFKESNSSSSSSNIIYIISQEEIKNNTTTTAMIEFEERLKALYDTAFNYQPNLFEIEALKEEIFHDDRFPLSEILLIVQESFRKTATYSPAKRKTNYVIKVIQSKKQEIFLKREQEKKMQEKLSAYSHFLSVYSSFDQLYLQVKSWVLNAISLRCEDVAKTKFRLYKTKIIKGIEAIEEVFSHPIIDLMLSSNPYFTWYDLLYMTIQNLDIQGNVYWLKIRDHMKVLREIRLIFPKHITIISDPDNYIKSYRYKDNSASFDIDPSDIIHFKRQKAGGMYYRQSMALSPMKLKKSSFTQFEAGP